MKIFNIGMPSKKASLNLSINAIVIVILAMTLMGLGLTFTRTIFGKLTSQTVEAFDKLEKELQTRLATGDEDFIFSSSKIEIGRGESSSEGFGLKNKRGSKVDVGIRFDPISCPKDDEGNDVCNPEQTAEPVDVMDWFTYKKGDGTYTINAADMITRSIDLEIPRNAAPGKYLLEIVIYQGTEGSEEYEEYATTDLFVVVG